jgi:hypothetical protein
MLESITALSKASNTEETGFAYGTIRSLNPLSVLVDGHSVALPEEFFILGQNVRPHKVTIPHKHEYNGETELEEDGGLGASSHKHSILKQVTEDLHEGTGGYKQDYVIIDIYPSLSVGDRVIMLRSNNGQKYYILERVENDTSNTSL